MNVLLLQMEHAEDIEDFGGLVSASPEAAEVKPVLPSDAGESPSAAPGEDPVSAPMPTVEGASEVVAEPAVEGSTAAAVPSQVAK